MSNRLPLLIEPEQLTSRKDDSDVVIVDLCKASIYEQSHVPGAIHIEYPYIVTTKPPIMGLVPEADQLKKVMSHSGIKPGDTVVAYDDEGGGKAARFLYTLDIIGHKNYALLNGGLHAWVNEGHSLESVTNKRPTSQYPIVIDETPIASREFILEQLDNDELQLIDSRSPAEYEGSKKFAERGGHIPGAINLDWVNLMDSQNNLRLKTKDEIIQMLAEPNIEADKTTVVYCQTHHRSALTYFVLKNLGFKNLKGYPGSWSEWGNNPNMPVETGQRETITT